jgi:hypothetical protein
MSQDDVSRCDDDTTLARSPYDFYGGEICSTVALSSLSIIMVAMNKQRATVKTMSLNACNNTYLHRNPMGNGPELQHLISDFDEGIGCPPAFAELKL